MFPSGFQQTLLDLIGETEELSRHDRMTKYRRHYVFFIIIIIIIII